MRKNSILVLCLVLAICLGLLSGCQKESGAAPEKNDNKIHIVCTIFPQYDWVKSIIGEKGENFDITLLLDKGTDLHNYQPTAEDMVKIADSDLFIYVGGESDKWVGDALKLPGKEQRQAISLYDVLGENVKEEEVIEGMEAEEKSKTGKEEPEYDEHVWLSLKNSQIITTRIAEALEAIDGENARTYEENCDSYQKQLKELNKEYQAVVDSAKRKTVLFGDRFPFRYMMDDYGLTYYAAFVGCSAETEASFETIAFLAGKMNELKLPAVLVIENSDQKIAKAIIKATEEKNQKILVMKSLQSITGKDMENGITYLSVMKDNLATLKQALN